MFLFFQLDALIKEDNNHYSTSMMYIQWVEWTFTLSILAGSFWKIKLVYIAWIGIYIRTLIWIFQWDDIVTTYKDDLDMLREMLTDTFVACSMEFLCMFVMDALISYQNKIFFWTINMSILALGITHRCFGLQNYFTEDHKSKSNGL